MNNVETIQPYKTFQHGLTFRVDQIKKKLAMGKHSSLFLQDIIDEEIFVVKLTPWTYVIKFFNSQLTNGPNKLESLSLASL